MEAERNKYQILLSCPFGYLLRTLGSPLGQDPPAPLCTCVCVYVCVCVSFLFGSRPLLIISHSPLLFSLHPPRALPISAQRKFPSSFFSRDQRCFRLFTNHSGHPSTGNLLPFLNCASRSRSSLFVRVRGWYLPVSVPLDILQMTLTPISITEFVPRHFMFFALTIFVFTSPRLLIIILYFPHLVSSSLSCIFLTPPFRHHFVFSSPRFLIIIFSFPHHSMFGAPCARHLSCTFFHARPHYLKPCEEGPATLLLHCYFHQ